MNSRALSLNDGVPLEEVASKITSVVLAGGVVLYPSDTVYGLLCRPDDGSTLSRLRNMKGISGSRPFILLVSGPGMAGSVADCTDPEVQAIIRLRWPGKLTLVLPALKECPPDVTDRGRTVALRHPADRLSGLVLEKCGMPLVSTSANVSGEGSCLDFKAIPDSLIDEVDLAVDSGKLPPSSPSTILKLVRGREE